LRADRIALSGVAFAASTGASYTATRGRRFGEVAAEPWIVGGFRERGLGATMELSPHCLPGALSAERDYHFDAR